MVNTNHEDDRVDQSLNIFIKHLLRVRHYAQHWRSKERPETVLAIEELTVQWGRTHKETN